MLQDQPGWISRQPNELESRPARSQFRGNRQISGDVAEPGASADEQNSRRSHDLDYS